MHPGSGDPDLLQLQPQLAAAQLSSSGVGYAQLQPPLPSLRGSSSGYGGQETLQPQLARLHGSSSGSGHGGQATQQPQLARLSGPRDGYEGQAMLQPQLARLHESSSGCGHGGQATLHCVGEARLQPHRLSGCRGGYGGQELEPEGRAESSGLTSQAMLLAQLQQQEPMLLDGPGGAAQPQLLMHMLQAQPSFPASDMCGHDGGLGLGLGPAAGGPQLDETVTTLGLPENMEGLWNWLGK